MVRIIFSSENHIIINSIKIRRENIRKFLVRLYEVYEIRPFTIKDLLSIYNYSEKTIRLIVDYLLLIGILTREEYYLINRNYQYIKKTKKRPPFYYLFALDKEKGLKKFDSVVFLE